MSFEIDPIDGNTTIAFEPLSSAMCGEVANAATAIGTKVASYLNELWTGSIDDLHTLDYDSYEFGGAHWYHDGGFGFTCAFGEILRKNFGFEWHIVSGGKSIRDCLLKYADADGYGFNVFPWHCLGRIILNSGGMCDPATNGWLDVLKREERRLGPPAGWSPVCDALEERSTIVPAAVLSEMRSLADFHGWKATHYGMWQYEWGPDTDWDDVKQRLKDAQRGRYDRFN